MVSDRGGHVARAKAVEHEGRKAVIDHGFGVRKVRGRDAEAAWHHHDSRELPLRLRFFEEGRNSLPSIASFGRAAELLMTWK